MLADKAHKNWRIIIVDKYHKEGHDDPDEFLQVSKKESSSGLYSLETVMFFKYDVLCTMSLGEY